MTAAASDTACYLGIDIGGTAIKAGLLDTRLQPIATAHRQTPTDGDVHAIASCIDNLARSLLTNTGRTRADLIAAGAGVPGRVEPDRGSVLACANIPSLAGTPLGAHLRDRLAVPVTLHNDANAAAFGEYAALQATNPSLRDFALVTLGTGIGSGLVLGGELRIGANQLAGEIGHMIVEPAGDTCPCGQRGCLERYAAAPAIVRLATADTANPPATAADVFTRAAAGDPHARAAIATASAYLAVALINVARVLDLQCVALGGGVAAAGEALAGPVRAALQARNWSISPTPLRVITARLGNDAGWAGAAALAAARHPAPQACPPQTQSPPTIPARV
jgi:glucokinase